MTAANSHVRGVVGVIALVSIETVVRPVAAGWSFDQILENYPTSSADIQQALEHAAAATDVHTHGLRSRA